MPSRHCLNAAAPPRPAGRAGRRRTGAGPRSRSRGRAARPRSRPPRRSARRAARARRSAAHRGHGRCRAGAGARRRRSPTGTIASSEVASARICGSSRKIASAGTKRIPPPTPSRPPTAPPANPSSAAPHVRPSADEQLDRDTTSSAAKSEEIARSGIRCWSAGAGDARRRSRGSRSARPSSEVDVAVQALAGGREGADDDDREQAGAGRLALAVSRTRGSAAARSPSRRRRRRGR